VALPNGRLVPLDQFFDQSLAVRHALKAIIAAEQHPMSDDELARQLCQQGYSVARRTVAKYRDMERIPPFSERVPRVPL
jgi:RNA polymerase sigma-54 factor